MKKSFELKQERQTLVNDARALIDTVETESRGFTPEEKTAHEERMAKIEDLTTQIEEREKLEGLQDLDETDLPGAEGGMVTRTNETDEEKEIREFGEALIEKRDYTSTMNSGTFRKHSVDTRIREGLKVSSQVRSVALVTSMAGDETIPVDGGDVDVDIIAEEGTYGDSGGSLGSIDFKAIKIGGIIKFSDEALKDVPANLVQNATNQIIRATAKKENFWCITGNGTTQPEGILTGSSQGEEAASASAIAIGDVRGLITSLDTEILANAYGWCHRNTMSALLALTDKNKGIKIEWDPTIRMYRVQGIPVFINNNMPEVAASAKPLLFGDPSYYEIKDRDGLEVKVLAELYAAQGKVGYRFTRRFDAHVMESEAFKYLAMPAS